MPDMSRLFSSALSLLAVYLPIALSEVVSYTPMLGTASYITFITGNVGNLKIPCALSAMQSTNSPLGTEEGDTVSAIAVSVSSMVTMLVILAGVFLLVPLRPILTTPAVKVATGNMLPALFGAMLVIYLSNNKSGGYVIKNLPLVMLFPMLIILGLYFAGVPIKGKDGYVMLAAIPATILIAYILYKTGLVKVVEDKKSPPPMAAEKPADNEQEESKLQ